MKEMKFSDILNENSLLAQKMTGKPFRISILSNIVTTQINEILEYALRLQNINAQVSAGDYDNIVQDSAKVSDSDCVIVFWEVGNLVDGFSYKIASYNDDYLKSLQEKIENELRMVFLNLSGRPFVFFNTFTANLFTNNHLETSNLDFFCDNLNQFLRSNAPNNFHLIDLNRIFEKISVKQSADWRFFYSSKALYTVDFYKEYVEQISLYILSTYGKAKKVICLDCDNTLWKGIIGEDGIFGIECSADSKSGIYFEEVQYLLLELARNGVILCLVSKNNEEDVNQVFQQKKEMILKEEHIVLKKINWNDKASNIKDIAKELNLGLDSFVFIDDSDFEINLVREQLPEVTSIQVPKKLYEYPQLIRSVTRLFFKKNTSVEDQNRTKLYKQELERDSLKKSFETIDDYLKSLNLKLRILKNDSETLPRIAQLTQKTNQFNLTTYRYTDADIEKFHKDPNIDLFAFSLEDKFGDYGLTGVSIVKYETNLAQIDTFLMSCRILGRKAEDAFIQYLLEDIKNKGVNSVKADFIKTEKNQQVENLYERFGFRLVNSQAEHKNYFLDLTEYNIIKLEYIEVLSGR
ncbi:NLI interacting factor-like phosphatase [Leptospira ryugenii]|uniref:NLI interacting factor-like phosphatase n=1 Tax=Leptospira ryugenii TaxID=1917863 RepID=A0A2P2DW33_9LEPT|nr:HAD-IIIC family phosphatase [Leptospira ryugenii]GBF48845.1 NLI interacting factor-like phosphatase [Leptospira ryugenii]